VTPKQWARRHRKLKRVGAGRFTYAEDRDPAGRDLFLVEREGVPFKKYYTPEHALEFLDMRRDEMYGRDRWRRNPPIAQYDPGAGYDEVWGEVIDIAHHLQGQPRRNPLPTQKQAEKMGTLMVDTLVKVIPKASLTENFREYIRTRRARGSKAGMPKLVERYFKYHFTESLKQSPSRKKDVLTILALLDLTGDKVKKYQDRSPEDVRRIASPAMQGILFDDQGELYPLEEYRGPRGKTRTPPYREAIQDLNRGLRNQAINTLQTWYDADPTFGYDVEGAKPAPAGRQSSRGRMRRPMEQTVSRRRAPEPPPEPAYVEPEEEYIEEEVYEESPTSRRPSGAQIQAEEIVAFLMQKENWKVAELVCDLLNQMRGRR
jgi:hypothetical protein